MIGTPAAALDVLRTEARRRQRTLTAMLVSGMLVAAALTVVRDLGRGESLPSALLAGVLTAVFGFGGAALVLWPRRPGAVVRGITDLAPGRVVAVRNTRNVVVDTAHARMVHRLDRVCTRDRLAVGDEVWVPHPVIPGEFAPVVAARADSRGEHVHWAAARCLREPVDTRS